MAWRKGSAGEKEAKEQKVVAAFLLVITILLELTLFVFPSELRDNVKASPVWMNIVGGVLVGISGAPIIRAFTAGEEGVRNYTRWWGVLMAAGIMFAAGFFGYTY
jgi:H+/Cl- antiporter ClcA